MKCRDWDKRLPSLLDEAPDSPVRRELEAHIAGCESCRRRWALLMQIRDGAGELGGLEPGEQVWQGIQQELAGPSVGVPQRTISFGLSWHAKALRWGGAAALAAASIAGLWFWIDNRPVVDPTPLINPSVATQQTAPIAPAARPVLAAVPAARIIKPTRARNATTQRRDAGERIRQYVSDGQPPSDDGISPGGRTQYVMPTVTRRELAGNNTGQYYIMPAAYAADREPF